VTASRTVLWHSVHISVYRYAWGCWRWYVTGVPHFDGRLRNHSGGRLTRWGARRAVAKIIWSIEER